MTSLCFPDDGHSTFLQFNINIHQTIAKDSQTTLSLITINTLQSPIFIQSFQNFSETGYPFGETKGAMDFASVLVFTFPFAYNSVRK